MRKNHKNFPLLITVVAIPIFFLTLISCLVNHPTDKNSAAQTSNTTSSSTSPSSSINADNSIPEVSSDQPTLESFQVTRVVDGDTIKINYYGQETSVRLIGINTPETVDPRKNVECFGKEASNFLTNKLTGKTIQLEVDPSQTDRDKYNRLLRYVYLDNEDIGLTIIQKGYGYEYTYNIPYAKQSEYKAAEKQAESTGQGLWATNACATSSTSTNQQSTTPQAAPQSQSTSKDSSTCSIKGNINNSGEHIYHLPGQKYYNSTKIDTSKGERWFCTEQEAINAGWRKSKV